MTTVMGNCVGSLSILPWGRSRMSGAGGESGATRGFGWVRSIRRSGGGRLSWACTAVMLPSPRASAPIARAAVRDLIVPSRPRHSMTGLAHEQGAGHLAPHGLDLLAAHLGGLEARHEHLETIVRSGIAALAQIRAEDE